MKKQVFQICWPFQWWQVAVAIRHVQKVNICNPPFWDKSDIFNNEWEKNRFLKKVSTKERTCKSGCWTRFHHYVTLLPKILTVWHSQKTVISAFYKNLEFSKMLKKSSRWRILEGYEHTCSTCKNATPSDLFAEATDFYVEYGNLPSKCLRQPLYTW